MLMMMQRPITSTISSIAAPALIGIAALIAGTILVTRR
jgi:hypothetical protein